MNAMRDNFSSGLKGVKDQLEKVQKFLEFYGSQLYDQLKKEDSSGIIFCFKWISIRFLFV